MNSSDLLKTEKDKIYDTLILPSITKDLKSGENPVAHILGGQPAAGKSHFIKKIIEQDKNVAIINGDDFRGYHPQYEYFLKHHEQEASDLIQKDINYWIEKTITDTGLKRYSMIIEGTLKKTSVPIKTAELLKDIGYFVNLDVILVNPEISKADMIKRYLLQKELIGVARFTKIEAQAGTVSKIFSNILEVAQQKEIDCLRLFRREIDNYNLLYERTSEYHEVDLIKILETEQKRSLTTKEIKYRDRSWEYIMELLKNHEEYNEIKEYVRAVRNARIEYGLGEHRELDFYKERFIPKG